MLGAGAVGTLEGTGDELGRAESSPRGPSWTVASPRSPARRHPSGTAVTRRALGCHQGGSHLGHQPPVAVAGPRSPPGSHSRSSQPRLGSARRLPHHRRNRLCQKCHQSPAPQPSGDSGGGSAGTNILLSPPLSCPVALVTQPPHHHIGRCGGSPRTPRPLAQTWLPEALRKRKVSSWKRREPSPRRGRKRERPSCPSSRHLQGDTGLSPRWGQPGSFLPCPQPWHSPIVTDDLELELCHYTGAGHALIHKNPEGHGGVGAHRRLDVDDVSQGIGGLVPAGGPGTWGTHWGHHPRAPARQRGPPHRGMGGFGVSHSLSYASRAKRRRLR